MQWYETIFEVIDMRSFSNLWFWIMLAVLWSTTSHWVLGVPFDLIQRARRQGGAVEADLHALLGIAVRRLMYIARVSGLWLVGFVSFFLTMLGILAFLYRIEFAQALFCLALPMSLVGLLTLRTAERLEALQPEGPPLYRMLSRHRMATQLVGMVSIFVTAMYGMFQNLYVGPF